MTCQFSGTPLLGSAGVDCLLDLFDHLLRRGALDLGAIEENRRSAGDACILSGLVGGLNQRLVR